jgi:integrase
MGTRPRKPKFKPYSVGRYRLNWYVDQFAAVWTDEDGVRRRHRLGVATEEEARAQLHAFARKHAALIAVAEAGSTHSVKALYLQYLADREAEGKQVWRIRSIWNQLSPVFGALNPEHIDRALCQRYAADRTALGKKPHTVHGELRVLRTVVNWAGKNRLVATVPIIWVPRFPPPRDRHLTRQEVTRLHDAAELPHIRLFILLAISTAARLEALLQLTWDRIDFDRGLIHLRVRGEQAARKGRAIVPMNATARAALIEAKTGAVSDYVIEWNGGPVKSVRRSLNTALKRAEIKEAGDGAHVLRHSAAVLMAEAGIPMSEISQYLGHSSTGVTEKVYARFSPDYLRRAGNALELPAVQLRANAR